MSSRSCSTQPGFGKSCRNSWFTLARSRQPLVEDEHGRAGGALVDGEHVRGHVSSSLAAASGQRLEEAEHLVGASLPLDVDAPAGESSAGAPDRPAGPLPSRRARRRAPAQRSRCDRGRPRSPGPARRRPGAADPRGARALELGHRPDRHAGQLGFSRRISSSSTSKPAAFGDHAASEQRPARPRSAAEPARELRARARARAARARPPAPAWSWASAQATSAAHRGAHDEGPPRPARAGPGLAPPWPPTRSTGRPGSAAGAPPCPAMTGARHREARGCSRSATGLTSNVEPVSPCSRSAASGPPGRSSSPPWSSHSMFGPLETVTLAGPPFKRPHETVTPPGLTFTVRGARASAGFPG